MRDYSSLINQASWRRRNYKSISFKIMKKKRRSTRWKVTNLFLAFQVAIVLVFSGGHVYGMVDEPLLNLT